MRKPILTPEQRRVNRLLKPDTWHTAQELNSKPVCLENLVKKGYAISRPLPYERGSMTSGQFEYSLKPLLRVPTKNFYFTFRQKDPHKNGYIKVEAKDYGAARNRMVSMYGDQWAFQYDEETFLPQIEQYGLYLVATL